MVKKIFIKCKGKKIEITPIIAEKTEDQPGGIINITAPGKGDVEISQPELSAASVAVNTPVRCKVTVKGRTVAQVFQESLFQSDGTMIGPLHCDYLGAPSEREVKGIVHPRWAAENQIEFEITPRLNLLTCGKRFTLACLSPEYYGVDPDKQIWSLEGVYQRGGGEPFRAKLEFDTEGRLVNKTGFYPAARAGSVTPFDLLVEEGDTFEPYVTLLSPDGTESLGTARPVVLSDGNALKIERAEPSEGIYQIGVAIEDFDGQITRKFSSLTIEK